MQGNIVSIGEWGSITSIREPWQTSGNAGEVNYGGMVSCAYLFNAHVLLYLCILIGKTFYYKLIISSSYILEPILKDG